MSEVKFGGEGNVKEVKAILLLVVLKVGIDMIREKLMEKKPCTLLFNRLLSLCFYLVWDDCDLDIIMSCLFTSHVML